MTFCTYTADSGFAYLRSSISSKVHLRLLLNLEKHHLSLDCYELKRFWHYLSELLKPPCQVSNYAATLIELCCLDQYLHSRLGRIQTSKDQCQCYQEIRRQTTALITLCTSYCPAIYSCYSEQQNWEMLT